MHGFSPPSLLAFRPTPLGVAHAARSCPAGIKDPATGMADMDEYDWLYRLYSEFSTDTLRGYQNFVDLFPPVDSRIALDYWEEASDELATRKQEIRDAFPDDGDIMAALAATATRDQAFTALDLVSKYNQGVNALVLDVDETLRSAGSTDNEIPRETLHLLTEFQETGIPIIVCTGQTLENVKGFLIQGLGNELVHSGSISIVYEAGTGVFTPGSGGETKRLLYESLADEIRAIFDYIRSRVLSQAPEAVRQECHLQGNEFNVTLKPNYETGSPEAQEIIDQALVYQLDLLEEAVEAVSEIAVDGPWARAYYAEKDPEIHRVLDRVGSTPEMGADAISSGARDLLQRIDVAFYEADAAEITSLELNKVVGVKNAMEVLGIEEPFLLVMGDSKSDLRVMEWVEEEGIGISAAPEHASRDVLDHVIRTDELVFGAGNAANILRTTAAMSLLDELT